MRPIQTRFRSGFMTPNHLTSPVTVTRRLIMQKAPCHPIAGLQALVSVRFQVLLSPSCSECFSPFLHSTGPLSVSQIYLALPDGAGKFKRGVSDPALLRILPLLDKLPLRGYHPLWPGFPPGSCRSSIQFRSPITPH